MPTVVVPFRTAEPKRRLAPLAAPVRAELARAMLADVLEAARPLGPAVVADGPGGQGRAVAAVAGRLTGPLLVVNADLPCATTADLAELAAAAPALVPAPDGTTNALALPDARAFVALFGPQSARRFRAALGARPLELPNLADDVDELADLDRLFARVGTHTRVALASLGLAA